MFQLLGSDGKEYGPITADQLREWIREGRAGGSTQVRRDSEREWRLLRTVPEFADIFQSSPATALAGSPPAPPVVRLFAMGFFLAAAINAMFMVFSVFIILRFASNGTFHPGIMYFVSWGFGLLELPLRIASGLGLLRRREWARKLAVMLAAIMTLVGAWALFRTFGALAGAMDFTLILRSPSFLLSNLWSVALLVFNLATVVVLSRRDVRAAFANRQPAV
jgi:hypothetical protein